MPNPLTQLKKSLDNNEILIPVLRQFLMEEETRSRTESGVYSQAVQEDAALSAQCFQDREAEYNHGSANPYKGYFHPSQLGACQRQLFYSEHDAPVDKYPLGSELLHRYLILETGTYTHVIFQNLCHRAGVLKERESLIVDHDEEIVGHCDGILNIPGHPDYNLEIKTINSMGFSRLNAAKDEHKMQATAYMRSKGLVGTIFVYLEKDRHGIKEYFYEYSEDFWKDTVRPRIQNYFTKRDTLTLPEREGNTPKTFPCLFCSYTKICFDSKSGERFMRTLKSQKPSKVVKSNGKKTSKKGSKKFRLVKRKRS